MQLLAEGTVGSLDQAQPIDLAHMAFAVARMRMRLPWAWRNGLWAASSRYLSSFSPDQLARLVWGMGRLKSRAPHGWLRGVCLAVHQLALFKTAEMRQLAEGLSSLAGSPQRLARAVSSEPGAAAGLHKLAAGTSSQEIRVAQREVGRLSTEANELLLFPSLHRWRVVHTEGKVRGGDVATHYRWQLKRVRRKWRENYSKQEA